MTFIWLILGSLAAYTIGLIIVVKMTPVLLSHAFDEGTFMGIAVVDVLGALLIFGAVVLIFALFNGAFIARVVDFFLLVAMLLVCVRISIRSFFPRRDGAYGFSRVFAGSYCLLLSGAALYCIIILFSSPYPP